MKLSLCNEVIRDLDFPAQCALAAELGYDGLEVAPFTLDDNPHLMSARRRAEVRQAAADAGILITSLHWLLVTPAGLMLSDQGISDQLKKDPANPVQLAPTRACIITCDRPASLERLLDSMLASASLARHDKLLLIDDSRSAADTQRHY